MLLYYTKCTDHKCEGILAYSFIDTNTEFHMTIIGVYLPPENSFHGRDRDVLFSCINVLFYQYQDKSDILLLCGDINVRISNVNEVKEYFNVFRIASRLTCDNITNGHGKQSLSFLYDDDIMYFEWQIWFRI